MKPSDNANLRGRGVSLKAEKTLKQMTPDVRPMKFRLILHRSGGR
jgi:hypothetical protein